MNLVRKILFPFAVLYGFITSIRNFLYDKGILKSHVFDISVIAVGNLSVGGTGKTPQIEYLIRLLSDNYKIATLSRGYKRQSEGFILADESVNAAIIGDEPFQYYSKFPNIKVAVDADRRNGIQKLLSLKEKPDLILLDDAFQHRKVRAGFYILLTSYGDLFSDDYLLPTGNLRESRKGAKRADLIIVTKCPESLTDKEQKEIKEKVGNRRSVFFSTVVYDDSIYSGNGIKKIADIKAFDKLVLAGIAKPKPFFDFVKQANDLVKTYPDHHHFSEADSAEIKKLAGSKIIITTEKDYVRLKDNFSPAQLFYLPIKTKFLSASADFDKKIQDYVGKSSGNS